MEKTWQDTAVADEARELAKKLEHMKQMEETYTATVIPPSTPSQGVSDEQSITRLR